MFALFHVVSIAHLLACHPERSRTFGSDTPAWSGQKREARAPTRDLVRSLAGLPPFGTNKEINPADVVANRANVAAQYNETFLNDNELTELW